VAVCLAARHMPIDQLRIDNWPAAPGTKTNYVGTVSSPPVRVSIVTIVHIHSVSEKMFVKKVPLA
jgi:hypothetical protein